MGPTSANEALPSFPLDCSVFPSRNSSPSPLDQYVASRAPYFVALHFCIAENPLALRPDVLKLLHNPRHRSKILVVITRRGYARSLKRECRVDVHSLATGLSESFGPGELTLIACRDGDLVAFGMAGLE